MLDIIRETIHKNEKMPRKRKVGKPTKYCPAIFRKAQRLYSEGKTEAEVAKALRVCVATLYQWRAAHPEFAEAAKAAKSLADDRVENALLSRALGMSVPDCHVSQHEGVVTITALEKHLPPDPLSMIFWLKNRRPKDWRDRVDVDANVTIPGIAEDLVAAIQKRALEKSSEKSDGGGD